MGGDLARFLHLPAQLRCELVEGQSSFLCSFPDLQQGRFCSPDLVLFGGQRTTLAGLMDDGGGNGRIFQKSDGFFQIGTHSKTNDDTAIHARCENQGVGESDAQKRHPIMEVRSPRPQSSIGEG